MKKWLVLILCLVAFPVYAGQLRVLSPFISSGGVTCTDTAVQCDTDAHGYNIGLTFNQLIKAQGAEITICQVDVWMNEDGTAGDAHVEIWNTDTNVQYGDDSDSQTIDAGSATEYNFTWSGTKPVVPNADFRLYVIEEDGNLEVRDSQNVNCYEDTNYDAWNVGADVGTDLKFNIHTDQ